MLALYTIVSILFGHPCAGTDGLKGAKVGAFVRSDFHPKVAQDLCSCNGTHATALIQNHS